jgi:hypothetical protein
MDIIINMMDIYIVYSPLPAFICYHNTCHGDANFRIRTIYCFVLRLTLNGNTI